MTTQEAYETIRAHFSQPYAEFAVITDCAGDPICKYRTDDGRKCAFGVLMPDELYDPSFETCSADFLLNGGGKRNIGVGVFVDAYDLADHFSGVNKSFILNAQYFHDTTATEGGTVEDFLYKLDDLARAHGLEVVA